MAFWQSVLRVPRWAVASALAAVATVPEILGRWLPFLVDAATATGVPVFAITALSLLQQPTVGLVLAWLLFAYLVFTYAHRLYPDEYFEVVDYDGFRALTTVWAVFMGIVAWGPLVPRAVPGDLGTRLAATLGVQSTQTAVFGGLAIGLVLGTLSFGLYLWRLHPASMIADSSDWTSMLDGFFYPHRSGASVREEWATLPPRWERRLYRTEAIAQAFVPVVVAVIVGLVGAVLNLFYPVPEVALFLGLIATRLLPDREPKGGGRHPAYLFDARFLDSVSGATRNMKGMILLLYATFGAVFSAALFILLFGFTVGAVGAILSQGFQGPPPATPIQWFGLVGGVVLLGAVFLSFVLTGPYSILHWARQFERIEPFARRWEAERYGDGESVDVSSVVRRPPGLLFPAHAPLLVLLVTALAAALLDPISRPVAAVFLIVAILLFAGASAGMVVGIRRTRRREQAQSLDGEDRDILLTLIVQVGLVTLVVGVDAESVTYDPTYLVLFTTIAVALAAVVYLPDISAWSRDFDGYRRFVRDLPALVLILALALALEFIQETALFTASPRPVQITLVALFLASVGTTAFGLYLDRLSEESR